VVYGSDMFDLEYISEPCTPIPATQEEFLHQLKSIASAYVAVDHTPDVIDCLAVEIRQAFRVCFEAGRINTVPQIYIDLEPFTRQVRVTTSKFEWKDAE
jgi:hypothetical protein